MKEKIELLKYTIDRYDTYIESTQTKSNLYLALNTAIVGGIITLLTTSGNTGISKAAIILLGLVALLSLMSIVLTLWAINPYLKNISGKSDSVLFFQEVAGMAYSDFHLKFLEVSKKNLFTDMTCQAYSLATALKKKYRKLMYAGRMLIAEFILLFTCIILFITKTI